MCICILPYSCMYCTPPYSFVFYLRIKCFFPVFSDIWIRLMVDISLTVGSNGSFQVPTCWFWLLKWLALSGSFKFLSAVFQILGARFNIFLIYCTQSVVEEQYSKSSRSRPRPRPATLLKKRLWHRCFPVIFVKFLRTPFYIEHLSGGCFLSSVKKLHEFTLTRNISTEKGNVSLLVIYLKCWKLF